MKGSGPQRSTRRSEREHCDLRWHPQAQRKSKRAQPRIHIQESPFLRACRRLPRAGGVVGPNGRRYSPTAKGVMRLAGLHWRFPSCKRI